MSMIGVDLRVSGHVSRHGIERTLDTGTTWDAIGRHNNHLLQCYNSDLPLLALLPTVHHVMRAFSARQPLLSVVYSSVVAPRVLKGVGHSKKF